MDHYDLESESSSDLTLSDDYKVIITITEDSKSRFICQYCDYSNTDKSDLQIHIQRNHTSEKIFDCSNYEHSYANESNFIQHQEMHAWDELNQYLTEDNKLHTNKNQEGYQCSHCYKYFAHRSYLLRHERIHTGEKPYQCTFCDKSFTQNSYLLQHIQIHTGEKSYQCNQCGKGFAQKAYLVRHKVIHTGKKPYRCNQCDQSFTRKCYLEKHQSSHAIMKSK